MNYFAGPAVASVVGKVCIHGECKSWLPCKSFTGHAKYFTGHAKCFTGHSKFFTGHVECLVESVEHGGRFTGPVEICWWPCEIFHWACEIFYLASKNLAQ